MLNNFYKNKRVLLTGHTGFKGSWLSLWLSRLGAHVTGYALQPLSRPNLFEVCVIDKHVTSVIADIRDRDTLKGIAAKARPEIIFHLAAQPLVRYSYKKPAETFETNIMGTVNLLEVCRRISSVRSVIIVTSDKCYKNRNSNIGYKEVDPLGGYDPYSASKGCVELVTTAYANVCSSAAAPKHGALSISSVRAGNVIGGGDWSKDRIIPDCIRAFTRNKKIMVRYPDARRPWQHVLEPLYAYLLLGVRLYEKGPEFSGAWNFGPDKNDIKPVRWLVERVAKTWGEGASWKTDTGRHPHETHYLSLDCSKAKTRLGWHPQWDLDEALQKTVDWYKSFKDGEAMPELTMGQIKEYERALGGIAE